MQWIVIKGVQVPTIIQCHVTPLPSLDGAWPQWGADPDQRQDDGGA